MLVDKVIRECILEMRLNPELYVDLSTNTVNLTALGEEVIQTLNVESKDETTVFETVIDWFDKWSGKWKYNN